MIHKATAYFAAFESKNLNTLESIFADDICLIDWELNIVGKSAVLSANKNIFNNIDTLKIIVDRLLTHNNTVIAEIKIIINKETTLNVVDILDFDQNDKIQKITAYKR